MKKAVKWVGVGLLLVAAALLVFLWKYGYDLNKNLAKMHKPDSDLLGVRMEIAREGQPLVRGNFYQRNVQENKKTPLIINIHGGAFISGNADTLDTQSKRISDDMGVSVFTIDYTLAPFYKVLIFGAPHIQYQVNEVSDSVRYFIRNADKYNINPNKIIIMGYSAGGYLTIASTLDLKKSGISIWAQIIGYGLLKDGLETYEKLPEHAKSLTNTLFVFTEKRDFASESGRVYYSALKANGVNVSKLEYPTAIHGFLEENEPEYEGLTHTPGRGAEQEVLARQAEGRIKEWINTLSK